jgi:hypothetical protein
MNESDRHLTEGTIPEFCTGTEENHKKTQQGYSVSVSKFQRENSRIRSKFANN